jgi:hypothetical protein
MEGGVASASHFDNGALPLRHVSLIDSAPAARRSGETRRAAPGCGGVRPVLSPHSPCRHALLLPFGAPLPGAPPCMRRRRRAAHVATDHVSRAACERHNAAPCTGRLADCRFAASRAFGSPGFGGYLALQGVVLQLCSPFPLLLGATYARTVLRAALNQAPRRGLVARNVAALVEPPRIVRQEVEPFTINEARARVVRMSW